MTDWRIEPLKSPADLDDVLAVERESFTNPWTRQMYVADLQNEGVSFIYLARDEDGLVVGFCSFWHILDEMHINNLAVLPARRREGVASALLARVLGEGTALGVRRATLEVRRSNLAAVRLYEKLGFRVTSIRPDYYTKPVEDALILWREGASNRPEDDG